MTQVIHFPNVENGNAARPVQNCAALFEDRPEIELQRGELLFEAPSHQVYLVTKGMIKLSMPYQEHDLTEDYYQAGDLFNCEALLPECLQAVKASALFSGTRVKRLPAYRFWKQAQSSTVFQQAIFRHLFDKSKRSRQQLLRVTSLSAEQRVVHFLLQYAKRSGQPVGLETVIKPIFTHKEIGQFAGTGRQTASTLLNKLRREKIIHFTRAYLIVRDMEALQALTESPYGNY